MVIATLVTVWPFINIKTIVVFHDTHSHHSYCGYLSFSDAQGHVLRAIIEDDYADGLD